MMRHRCCIYNPYRYLTTKNKNIWIICRVGTYISVYYYEQFCIRISIDWLRYNICFEFQTLNIIRKVLYIIYVLLTFGPVVK